MATRREVMSGLSSRVQLWHHLGEEGLAPIYESRYSPDQLTAAFLGDINRAFASAIRVGFLPSTSRVSMRPSTQAFRPSVLVVLARRTKKFPASAGLR